MAAEEQFAFVLVRTKAAGNIGAAARALKNMGLSDLRLVAPAAGTDRIASEMAVHGREILQSAHIYPKLADALHDRTLTIGTTRRTGLHRIGAKPLRQAAGELMLSDPADRIAIVFGPEDHGLSNADLKHCHRLITIPTAPQYASINLAQSVMLVAYELFMARWTNGSRTPLTFDSKRDRLLAPAPAAGVEMMLERLEQALTAIGFLASDNTGRIMFALRELLGRAGLRARELDILNGIAHQVLWFAQGGREIIDEKREAGKKIR